MSHDSFVFTHIPKCGGSSFRRYLYNAGLTSGLKETQMHIPGEGSLGHDKNYNQLSLGGRKALVDAGVKILADHTKLLPAVYESLDLKQPFVYTIFRHPKKRFISHYNFFYKKLGNGKCLGVEIPKLTKDKLVEIIKTNANVQTAYLLGIEPGYGNRKQIMERFSEVDDILENKLSSFGILEELESSMRLLSLASPDWLTLPEVVQKVNANRSNKEAKYGRVDLWFKEFNQFDNRLYNKAVRLFRKRIEKAGIKEQV